MAKAARASSLLWLAVPVTLAVIGLWLIIDHLRFYALGEPAVGTIVLAQGAGGGSGNSPAIRYTASDGVTRETPTPFGASSFSYREGQQVEILDNPRAPGDVQVKGSVVWVPGVVLVVIGIWISRRMIALYLRRKRDAGPSS